LFYTASQNEVAQNFVNKFHGKFLIGVNLEGAVKGKKIEYEDLEEISRRLYKIHNNIKIIILSTPNNYQNVKKIIKKMGLDYVLMSFKTDTILAAAALITKFDLIITPDTSIVHIASTFDKPIVTIHENNKESYELFAPTSRLNRTVFSNSKNSLNGFSLNLLTHFCLELINLIKKENHE